jgi:hypothetical protein
MSSQQHLFYQKSKWSQESNALHQQFQIVVAFDVIITADRHFFVTVTVNGRLAAVIGSINGK